jgi:hypothetical protein
VLSDDIYGYIFAAELVPGTKVAPDCELQHSQKIDALKYISETIRYAQQRSGAAAVVASCSGGAA